MYLSPRAINVTPEKRIFWGNFMITIQNQYIDLIQGVLAHVHMRAYPAGTSFRKKMVKGRFYWYARLPDGKERYVGRDSPEIVEIIGKEEQLFGLDRENAALVKAITVNGFPVPGRPMAKTVRALSDAGFFRLRGVLVGTLACQTYFPMFGETPVRMAKKLPAATRAAERTRDADFAMFHAISVAVDDTMDVSFAQAIRNAFPFEQETDVLGHPIPVWIDRTTGMSVDLLSPLGNADDGEDSWLPSIRAPAVKLRFLDFLIHDEMPAALLSGSGIAVNVPRPERYAVHKLIVSRERRDPAKREKDMFQAVLLAHHLLENDHQALLDAFSEAWDRGPGWRKRLSLALASPLVPDMMRRELDRTFPSFFPAP